MLFSEDCMVLAGFTGFPSVSCLSPSGLTQGEALGMSSGMTPRGGDPNALSAWMNEDTLGDDI